jgi:hypothetical protein
MSYFLIIGNSFSIFTHKFMPQYYILNSVVKNFFAKYSVSSVGTFQYEI